MHHELLIGRDDELDGPVAMYLPGDVGDVGAPGSGAATRGVAIK